VTRSHQSGITVNRNAVPFDAKSYFAALLADTNRNPIARLHFNLPQKYIGILDAEKEEGLVPISSLEEIYEHTHLALQTIRSHDRQADKFRLVAYPTAKGCAAAYFPEANALVHKENVARESNTPASRPCSSASCRISRWQRRTSQPEPAARPPAPANPTQGRRKQVTHPRISVGG